ncbi:hypothetical protein ACF06T_14575 [Streptomyces albidoflavus]
MTPDDGRCHRPLCRFSRRPTLTDGGEVEVNAYCSWRCEEWQGFAVTVALQPETPSSEADSLRLFMLSDLLNGREHPDAWDDDPRSGVDCHA